MTYSTVVTRPKGGPLLPLAYQADPKLYQSVTVAQLVLTDLAVGELVQASGFSQVELLPAGPDRAMHCRYLKVTKTGSNSHKEGLLLVQPAGHNVTAGAHYSLLPVNGSFVVNDAWAGTVTVMLVNYAANLSGNPDDIRSLAVKYVELRADRWSGQ